LDDHNREEFSKGDLVSFINASHELGVVFNVKKGYNFDEVEVAFSFSPFESRWFRSNSLKKLESK